MGGICQKPARVGTLDSSGTCLGKWRDDITYAGLQGNEETSGRKPILREEGSKFLSLTK